MKATFTVLRDIKHKVQVTLSFEKKGLNSPPDSRSCVKHNHKQMQFTKRMRKESIVMAMTCSGCGEVEYLLG